MKIFISHSSADREVAGALADLFQRALLLPVEEIRCTSVPAYQVAIGVHTSSTLRQEIRTSEVFVGVLTPASLASTYVLFELGARWGADLPSFPMLGPGATRDLLRSPLSETNVARTDNRADVQRLLSQVAETLKHPMQPAHSYEDLLSRLVSMAPAAATAAAPGPPPPRPASPPVEQASFYHFRHDWGGSRTLILNQAARVFQAMRGAVLKRDSFPMRGVVFDRLKVEGGNVVAMRSEHALELGARSSDSEKWQLVEQSSEDVTWELLQPLG